MGWISVVFADKVLELAGADAATRARLSKRIGVKPERAADPTQMIEDTAFFDLLEALVRADPSQRDVAVKLGASMRCEDYGAFGLAFKCASDLRGSYQRVERYGRVVTSIANFRVVPTDATSRLAVMPAAPERLGLQMTRELAVAAAVSLSREVCRGEFRAETAHMRHPGPRDRTAFDDHFRCPVVFDAEYDGLEVAHEVLSAPNRLGDESFSRFFDGHLDQALADLPRDQALEPRVRAEIAQALSEGVPTLSAMARRLGMGGRTLQRRLAEEGLAYQALVEDARRELAGRLLRGSDYSLAEVAFLTGFADQSTFSRAFKRWHGRTPRAYRQSLPS